MQGRTHEAALQGGPAKDQVLAVMPSIPDSSGVNTDDILVSPRPDPIGKYRRKVMREMKRLPEYRSWHPAQKKKMRHLVMRHMNPQRGFMMRQGKFAEELGVRREKVNIFLRQAVERGLLTEPRGSDGIREGWRGANVYFVHPRVLETAQPPAHQGAHSPAHRGAQLEVTQGKLHKGSSALAEADRCTEALQHENYAAASADAPAAREGVDEAWLAAEEVATDDREEQALTGDWDEEVVLTDESADLGERAVSDRPPMAVGKSEERQGQSPRSASTGKTLHQILAESFVKAAPSEGSARCQDSQLTNEVAF